MKQKVVAILIAAPAILLAGILSGLTNSSSKAITPPQSDPNAIYLITSGLVYSDSLTTGDTNYWDLNGSAIAAGAPHSYSEDPSGLKLGLLAPASLHWAGYYAASPLTPARLFHTKIALGNAHPIRGFLDTAVYVQQQMIQDPRIDAMGCGADIYPDRVHWTVSLQAGDQFHEIVPQTVYSDNSANQPKSRDCTLVTDGNNTLTAYIDGQRVFSSHKMNLNMPEPLQYYIELQTNSVMPSAGSNFTGTFSDYYATSSDLITVMNVEHGSVVRLVDATSGRVLANATSTSTDEATLDVGMYHMPFAARIQVLDSSGTKVVASSDFAKMYGGDLYNLGSPIIHRPSIHLVSNDMSTNQDFGGVAVNVSSSSGTFPYQTPATFTFDPSRPYIIAASNDESATFVRWADGIDSAVRVFRPMAADEQLTALYTSDPVPPPPSSLTSLTQYTTNVSAPSITGNGIPGLSVQLYDNFHPVGSRAVVADNMTWTIKLPPLSDGSHMITATESNLTDTGQFSTSPVSGAITMTIDTIPPSVKISSGSFNALDNVSLTGTASDPIVGLRAVDVRIDHGSQFLPATQTVVGDWSNWSFESSQMIPGNHFITVRATNLAGAQAFAYMNLNIPPPNPSIFIKSYDVAGTEVTGMWTVLMSNGTAVKTGFTPVVFKIENGKDFSIIAADYGTNFFDHWHDSSSGMDVHDRTITVHGITNPIQLTAVFRYTALPSGSSIMVSGADMEGHAVNGMHVVVTNESTNITIGSGYTPVYFATSSSHWYIISASDFGNNYFDHWHYGASGLDVNSRSIPVDASSGPTILTAVYRHAP